MPLRSPIAIIVITLALIVVIGRCTYWSLRIMARMKEGTISKLEGWSLVLLLSGIALATIPLGRWFGFLPQVPARFW